MQHYASIMAKVIEFCDSSGLTKSEVLLELDFVPDDRGIAPALRDPPAFIIKESRGYFEGSRPNEPDWFYKKEWGEACKIPPATVALKDQYGRMTGNHLLCFVRHPGSVHSYRMQGVVQQRVQQAQMFGEEALSAFRCAIQHDDFGPLSKIFHEVQVRSIRKDLGKMPSEVELDRVRMMMNAFGGDFPLRANG